MAFADTLVAHTEAEIVLVDRRHRPGGHWLDAYPFVRLHQPSAYYGVESMALGNDRIDEHGSNAGFYERASAAEICDYYSRVLADNLLPTGRVRFLGMSEYRRNGDGHLVVSLLDGSETVIRPRYKVVDATYVQSEIPSRHVPGFTVEPGVTLVPPNGLVELAEPADRSRWSGRGSCDRHVRVAPRGGSRPRPDPLDTGPRSVAVRPQLHAAARPGRVVHAAPGPLGPDGGGGRRWP
jgi:hypothetical protein